MWLQEGTWHSQPADRTALLAVLRHYRVPQQLIDIIKELYTGTLCCVITAYVTSEDFEVKTGVRQGCVLSPLLFNCFMDRILREAMEMTGGGLHVEYTTSGGLLKKQDSDDHLHPEYPVCRQPDPCCRDQEGATADAVGPRQSLHSMGNEDQWREDQGAQYRRTSRRPSSHHIERSDT